jgi:hypothetical protein
MMRFLEFILEGGRLNSQKNSAYFINLSMLGRAHLFFSLLNIGTCYYFRLKIIPIYKVNKDGAEVD